MANKKKAAAVAKKRTAEPLMRERRELGGTAVAAIAPHIHGSCECENNQECIETTQAIVDEWAETIHTNNLPMGAQNTPADLLARRTQLAVSTPPAATHPPAAMLRETPTVTTLAPRRGGVVAASQGPGKHPPPRKVRHAAVALPRQPGVIRESAPDRERYNQYTMVITPIRKGTWFLRKNPFGMKPQYLDDHQKANLVKKCKEKHPDGVIYQGGGKL